jgi:hypothetical protein
MLVNTVYRLRKKGSIFFSEEKKQKTFVSGAPGNIAALTPSPACG